MWSWISFLLGAFAASTLWLMIGHFWSAFAGKKVAKALSSELVQVINDLYEPQTQKPQQPTQRSRKRMTW